MDDQRRLIPRVEGSTTVHDGVDLPIDGDVDARGCLLWDAQAEDPLTGLRGTGEQWDRLNRHPLGGQPSESFPSLSRLNRE